MVAFLQFSKSILCDIENLMTVINLFDVIVTMTLDEEPLTLTDRKSK